jgi:hypothetical protein
MSADVETEVSVTAHGEIQYETVTCSSCGSTVPEEDAKRFVIGDVVGITHWGALEKREYKFDTSNYQEGWACKYCRNDDVIDFPLKSVRNPSVLKLLGIAVALAFFSGLLLGGVLVA